MTLQLQVGLCHCGCGGTTKIAKNGKPNRYMRGRVKNSQKHIERK
jgi:hypothetical protein